MIQAYFKGKKYSYQICYAEETEPLGLGKRMHPVTLTTPKPLVRINGTRMINTIIDGLHSNGIYEIYVVVGYLKEKYGEFEKEYPDVKLIENPDCVNLL